MQKYIVTKQLVYASVVFRPLLWFTNQLCGSKLD